MNLPELKTKWISLKTEETNLNRLLDVNHVEQRDFCRMAEEIPEICNQYDELSSFIHGLESNIESLENEAQSKTKLIKEYLEILKDAKEVGMGIPRYHIEFLEDRPKIDEIQSDLEYYKKKIIEINNSLLKNDEIIKSGKESLQVHYKELEDMSEKVNASGWVKLAGLLWTAWVTEEEGTEKLKQWGVSRIV